jgi:uncharacterized membrane protein YhhN
MASTLARNPVLPLLWVVWAVLLLVSFALSRRTPGYRLPTWGKIASSVALAAAGWAAAAAGLPMRPAGLLVALGMTAGLAGDLALAPLLPLPQPTLAGIAAFGVGHLLYCAAFLSFAAAARLTAPWAIVAALAVWLGIGVAGWYYAVWRDNEHGLLHRVALAYALLLATTAGLASALALQRPSLAPLAAGGALFLLSDLLLAAGLFRSGGKRASDYLIWGTYGPAQMLIVYSLVLATI